MKTYIKTIVLVFFMVNFGCRPTKQPPPKDAIVESVDTVQTKIVNKNPNKNYEGWTEITSANGVELDIRYATDNNFTNKVIYPCSGCFLRPEFAKIVIDINRELMTTRGCRLKIFDCYRPRPAQQKLWDIVPDARYVTPPSKGSMHNRGLAIDVTIVNSKGQEFDMGTSYDFFGPEAHVDNMNHPEKVLENRKLLRELFESRGCKGIRTEWWHFSYEGVGDFSSWEWPCE